MQKEEKQRRKKYIHVKIKQVRKVKLFLKGSLVPKKYLLACKRTSPVRDVGARREVEIPRYLCTTLHTVYNVSKLLIDSIKFNSLW